MSDKNREYVRRYMDEAARIASTLDHEAIVKMITFSVWGAVAKKNKCQYHFCLETG